jgi:hypothetical protein
MQAVRSVWHGTLPIVSMVLRIFATIAEPPPEINAKVLVLSRPQDTLCCFRPLGCSSECLRSP